jgi:hypothetical protein
MKGLGGAALGGQVGGTLGDIFRKQPVEHGQMPQSSAAGNFRPVAMDFMNLRHAFGR